MKRILPIFIICILLLTGCIAPPDTSKNDKFNIVTTVFPQYDLARAVCGDKANLTMLLSPGVDVHSFEPSPADIIKIQNADIFIYTGGESDTWVNTIKSGIKSECVFFSLMDKLPDLLTSDEHHAHADEYDEHIWTSPKNAVILSKLITEKICEVDSENAQYYKENLEKHITALDTLDKEFASAAQNGKRNTIVFGDKFPFLYLANEYNLTYHAALPGCGSETEPSAAKVAEIIDFIKAENIPVVFTVELSNQKVAKTISEATGATLLPLHSCHNISKDDFENAVTYIDLMTQNVQNLKQALN